MIFSEDKRESTRMTKMTLIPGIWLTLSITLIFSSSSHAGWFDENMIDPGDGKLDVSNYLASANGFLPVPIIITEPAVGYGLGAAVAYFHQSKEIDRKEHPHQGPPSISVGFGAETENGTYLYGGAHSGVWKDDHIRYLGAIARANVNMTFYPNLGQDAREEDGIDFNVDGTFLFQRLNFRLKESNWWLGVDYLYLNAENTFKSSDETEISLPDPRFEFTQGGLGAAVEYDGRNTTFTPTKGLRANLKFRNYANIWGGDFDYNHLQGSADHYTPFGDYSSLGLRLEGEKVSGKAPFFAYPFVNLRGIPAMRYQGEEVVTAEAEYLWGLTPRWSLVFFGGVGKTFPISEFEVQGETVAAGGMGFRYRLARKLGLQLGMDVARGPEDTAVYLTMGSAWR
jgi:hypothetical protein